MSEANKELSRRFTELFSTGDEALADEVLSHDVVFHGATGDGEIRGVDAKASSSTSSWAATAADRSSRANSYFSD